MDEEPNLPWWRTPLRAIGIFLGLLALSAVLMGFIIFVARFLDTVGRPTYTPAPLPSKENARTRIPSPYGPTAWPDSPGRRPGVGVRIGGGMSGSGGSSAPTRPGVPVGVSVEEYRDSVESGKKVYLPNPKGECDVSGASVAKSTDALESCFAKRVAR